MLVLGGLKADLYLPSHWPENREANDKVQITNDERSERGVWNQECGMAYLFTILRSSPPPVLQSRGGLIT